MVARPRPAVPGLGAARPRLRRPARRRARRAAGAAAGRRARGRAVRAGSRWSAGRTSASRRLLNRLANEERAVVDSVAGTTVDPVDSLVQIGGETGYFVDTAGLRRRVSHASGTEYYASLRTAGGDRGGRGRGRAARRRRADQRAGPAGAVAWSPRPAARWCSPSTSGTWSTRTGATTWTRRSTASCGASRGRSGSTSRRKTGRAVDKLAPALRPALASWEQRVPTGQLNQFITALVQATPHPVRGGRAPRVLFATQAGTRPPRFVLFTTGLLDAGYVRFVERKLREEFGFEGTPVQISVRPRKRTGTR